MNNDFASKMANAKPLSEDEQKKIGTPDSGDMSDEHKNFVQTVSRLLESGEIDVANPETFLNQEIYNSLDPSWKAKTDQAIGSIAILLSHIYDFYKSKQTPDACPQLESMINQLWEMKQRLEVQADIFKF